MAQKLFKKGKVKFYLHVHFSTSLSLVPSPSNSLSRYSCFAREGGRRERERVEGGLEFWWRRNTFYSEIKYKGKAGGVREYAKVQEKQKGGGGKEKGGGGKGGKKGKKEEKGKEGEEEEEEEEEEGDRDEASLELLEKMVAWNVRVDKRSEEQKKFDKKRIEEWRVLLRRQHNMRASKEHKKWKMMRNAIEALPQDLRLYAEQDDLVGPPDQILERFPFADVGPIPESHFADEGITFIDELE